MPTTNQMISRSHVRQGRATISASAEIAPSGATSQTAGVLKGRGRLGSRTRRNSTPAETITKASSVPIDTRLPASSLLTVREAGSLVSIGTLHPGRDDHEGEQRPNRHQASRFPNRE